MSCCVDSRMRSFPFIPGRLWMALLVLAGASLQSARGGTSLCGGWQETSVTNEWVLSAATFAIKAQEQVMSREKPARPVSLSLVEVLQARQQVVAGMNYGLRLKVKVGGLTREAEAVIWRKLDGEHLLTSWVWR